MSIMTGTHPTPNVPQRQFLTRTRLSADPEQARALAQQVIALLNGGKTDEIRTLLARYYPADVADIMYFLDDKQDDAVFALLNNSEAAEVIDEVDACSQEQLARATPPDRLAQILKEMPSDEATDIVQRLPPEAREPVLAQLDRQEADQIRTLLPYPPESAGGIMTLGYIAVPAAATIGQAVQTIRGDENVDLIPRVFVVGEKGDLLGTLDWLALLDENPQTLVRDVMTTPVISVPPAMDQERVARIFARYDLLCLPVVEPSTNKLIGVITSDDVIDVIEAESTEDMMRMAGSDAEEMERRSPVRTALLRLPWIMATMFIELGAGVVIHLYDQTLARILLLASFMPIISAISGNTGLQSATIIVRGISAGQVQVTEWRRALLRQLTMTLLLGAATGLTLGTIGAFWYGKWTFGLVVALGMFAAVNIAGIVGTIVPLISKNLGFDPAITSGPFETAFQDVVGISIFLTLATVMLRYLV